MTALCIIILALAVCFFVADLLLFRAAVKRDIEGSRLRAKAETDLDEARDVLGEAYCTLRDANEANARNKARKA